MKLKEIRPMLCSEDLKGTVDFYTQQLGFTCGEFNEDWGWAAFNRDDIEFMVALPNEHFPFDGPKYTGTFYVLTEDVDAFWEEIKDKDKICYPLENFEHGMREFAVFDNNGYLLQFGQPIT